MTEDVNRPPLQGNAPEVIRAIEARIDCLRAEMAQAEAALAELRSRVQADVPQDRPQTRLDPRLGPTTVATRLALFQERFRGRNDVFPVRFVSARTGKAGYAPSCRNKFVPGLCLLPSVKCGDCTNQRFDRVDEAAVADHLLGKHVMGVYPLLDDNSCWFLAIDFDKHDWQDDVLAFTSVCRERQVPCALERSRSGNGAHVWFFFSRPVAAITARAFGSALLTDTMARRPELGFDSYDRLFPSQDSLPKGGFGNLIALPLQGQSRKSQNTVFLDEALTPVADELQWAYLSAVARLDPAVVDSIVGEAASHGGVLGVRALSTDDDAAPWRPECTSPKVPGPFPASVRLVLADRVYVEKRELPPGLLNQLKRLAAFQNPMFYERQRLRFSTARIPRIIACGEDLPLYLALPRGCRDDVERLLRTYGIGIEVQDERTQGEPIEASFRGTLTALQSNAIDAISPHDCGILVGPPGSGKTVMGAAMIARRGCTTLVLVHRRALLDQWREQLALFLGLETTAIGQVGAGKHAATGVIDVAMAQSLVRGAVVNERVSQYGHVIVDECHHVPAVSFERLLSAVRAKHVLGLTATPQRRDGHHPITEMQLGPVRVKLDVKQATPAPLHGRRVVIRDTKFVLPDPQAPPSIQQLYALLVNDHGRNELILCDVLESVRSGRRPLVLTERRDHLEVLTEQIRARGRTVIALWGGRSARERQAAIARLAAVTAEEPIVVLATGRYLGEGFDVPWLDTLFLGLPIAWRGTLVQYAGRLHRTHDRKVEIQIFDYVDQAVPMLARMFEKRRRGYRALGYTL